MKDRGSNPLAARLSAVSAAAAAGVMKLELDAVVREAALKLPRKQALKECAEALQEQLGMHLMAVIEAHLGEELVDPQRQLAGRFFVVGDAASRWEGGRLVHVPPQERGDTYSLDETPLLWAGPVKLETVGDEVSASRPLRLLVQLPTAANDS